MTQLIIALSAALLPALLLWIYIWKKDPQPEPTRWLVKATAWGVAICFPVALVEMAIETSLIGSGIDLSSLTGAAADAFIVAAVPEESFKLLVLWLVLRKNPYFDEHFDGIVYAVCVGLGFAALENVFYVLDDEEWLSVAIVRALLAVPGHYAFAILMGYYYSVYHFVDHTPKTAVLVLLAPVLAHGAYDTLAMSGRADPYIGSVGFIVLIYFCVRMHKVARKKVLALIESDGKKQTIT